MLLCVVSPARAVDIVPGALAGTLTQDSNLLAGQTYTVTGDVTVSTAVTLSIQAGAQLKFDPGTRLTVNGSLIVSGATSSKVTFTSANTTPAKSDWWGIVIAPGAGSVIIDHAVIEWATRGISFDQAGGEVHHSVIQNNSHGINVGHSAGPQITLGNVITGNNYGVFIQGNAIAGQNPNPVVTGNSLYGNSSYDYYANSFGSALTTTLDAGNNWWGTADIALIAANIYDNADNTFNSPLANFLPFQESEGGASTNGTGLAGSWDGTPLVSGQIYHVLDDFSVPPGSTLTIPAGVAFKVYGAKTEIRVDGSLNVQGTATEPVTFTSGNVTPAKNNWLGIVISPGAGSVVIDHAVIEWAYSGIYFDQAGGEVHHSVIQNNLYGINVGHSAGPQITLGNVITGNNYGVFIQGNGIAGQNPNPVVTGNSLYGNSSYDYYANSFGSALTTTLDAGNNWWGTADIASIAANIYDNADNTYNSPRVNFLPFQESEGGASTNGSGLAGTWNGTPLVSGQVYHVLDDFSVPLGSTLTIPAGVAFKVYGAKTEIRIDGSLNVQGTATEPVVFTSGKATPAKIDWQGIVIAPGAGSVVIDHAVIEWAYSGVFFDQAGGEVHHSVIQNNLYGIYVGHSAGPHITQANVITGNNYGVFVLGNGIAGQNPNPLVTGNSLYSNSSYDYYANSFANATTTTLDAGNNWWGTTDIVLIAANIYDNADNTFNSPLVNIDPVLQIAPTAEVTHYVTLNLVTINRTAVSFDAVAQRYFTLNSVSNPAGANVKGPVRLVVASSSLAVLNPNGYTNNNEPYFDISSSAGFALATGATTPDVRIEFENVSTALVYNLRAEVVDSDADAISDAYELQVGTNPGDPLSSPADINTDGIPDVINDLAGSWTGPCRDLGNGEYAQEELAITMQDFKREIHSAYSQDCQSRWITVNNSYAYSMRDIGNVAGTGADLDLKLAHVYVIPHESAVSDSLNQSCTKQNFLTGVQNIADSVQCESGVVYPDAGITHYDKLKNNVSIQLGNKLDIIDPAQRAVELDTASFSRTAP